VPVKLRSTLNDNRKADKSVPLFDRNSTELRRVTFRENSDAITPASTISYRSEAEKAQIKRTGLTDDERSQAELFYKGHKTEVTLISSPYESYYLFVGETISKENFHLNSSQPA